MKRFDTFDILILSLFVIFPILGFLLSSMTNDQCTTDKTMSFEHRGSGR